MFRYCSFYRLVTLGALDMETRIHDFAFLFPHPTMNYKILAPATGPKRKLEIIAEKAITQFVKYSKFNGYKRSVLPDEIRKLFQKLPKLRKIEIDLIRVTLTFKTNPKPKGLKSDSEQDKKDFEKRKYKFEQVIQTIMENLVDFYFERHRKTTPRLILNQAA